MNNEININFHTEIYSNVNDFIIVYEYIYVSKTFEDISYTPIKA